MFCGVDGARLVWPAGPWQTMAAWLRGLGCHKLSCVEHLRTRFCINISFHFPRGKCPGVQFLGRLVVMCLVVFLFF